MSCRQRSPPNLLRKVAIGTIVLLLIGSRFVWIPVALVHFGVVGIRGTLSRRILGHRERPTPQQQQAGKQEIQITGLLLHLNDSLTALNFHPLHRG